MQTPLTFFPSETKLINTTSGLREQDGFVCYHHSRNSIYCHSKEDINSCRFILGDLISNHLCGIRELSESPGENRKNIERYVHRFREKGAGDFFSRKETRCQCYKETGELGKLTGYDRIPEVKKLRGMIRELTNRAQSRSWDESLSRQWIEAQDSELYYVDGHVQVYHGYLAELGQKHVSCQRLCLPGMMEFWVNSPAGLPFFFITAEVNEKMIEMPEAEIIPRLLKQHPPGERERELLTSHADYPRFTPVFDREAYSPVFFMRLWDSHRIAVLTYRKDVKDEWDEALFEEIKVETFGRNGHATS